MWLLCAHWSVLLCAEAHAQRGSSVWFCINVHVLCVPVCLSVCQLCKPNQNVTLLELCQQICGTSPVHIANIAHAIWWTGLSQESVFLIFSKVLGGLQFCFTHDSWFVGGQSVSIWLMFLKQGCRNKLVCHPCHWHCTDHSYVFWCYVSLAFALCEQVKLLMS